MVTRRPSSYQRYAWRVQDILVGCGLSQSGSSLVGGTNYYLPKVTQVFPGPPPGPPRALNVQIMPGQSPDDYARHARTIAYNLDLAAVRVTGLGPYLIQLELVPRPATPPAP
ncbi:MAG: hypothetical protein ACRDRG_14160 [Pseudonocardiaceae bacterium]